ncbi:SMI1/KNR4 family protein [Microbispora sitophila]|uniref:SMI1/KNR4 family protein n=1 Tax=Microbispora sitophila TaxID=2771537 RepID=UPI00299F80BD|nr:SMI1/KNR4 family protein [Microbispora sitophila]
MSSIDAWLAAHAPVTLAMLNSSATAEAVESAQQVLGMRFPDELTESLKCHDGAIDWMSLFPEQQSPLSASGIARQWQIHMETASDSDGFVRRPWDDEPWWHPRWIPWAETADGVAHIIDLRPGLTAAGSAGLATTAAATSLIRIRAWPLTCARCLKPFISDAASAACTPT